METGIHRSTRFAETEFAESLKTATRRNGRAAGGDLVVATLRQHAGSLLRTARRYSLCAADAEDAYQRGLEIFLRRADSLDPERAAAWLRTVIKHEALAVRKARSRLVPTEASDLDLHEASDAPAPDERFERFERLTRASEALERLKPQELRALLLKAEGHSYNEICDLTGWTYTKVNRCITEGRKSFLERYRSIESGAECERWTGVLSAIADGEASPKDVRAVRPHLRRCPACRATVREFRGVPGTLAALIPIGALLPMSGDRGMGVLLDACQALGDTLHRRIALAADKIQGAVELGSSGKLAAVAASATAIAGGGVVAVEAPRKPAVHHRSVGAVARARAPRGTQIATPRTTPALLLRADRALPDRVGPRSAPADEFGFEGPRAGAPSTSTSASPAGAAGTTPVGVDERVGAQPPERARAATSTEASSNEFGP